LGEAASLTEILGTVPIFRGLENADLKAIAALSKESKFRAGETIVKQGDAGLGFYIILDGQATVRRGKKTIAKLGRGSFFGEMALFDDQPRSADVIAEEPTTCQVLLRWNFWSLVSKNNAVARGIFREMARRLRATNEAMSE
jgi:CRP/FNR family transcriptional regulator, cyclic AMP receptor protein